MADVADAPVKKPKGPAISKQTKAGLTFAVSRVEKKLRHAKIAKQVAGHASVYLTGVVEHVILKVIEEAGAQAAMRKSKRVTDAHVIAAVRSDPDVARAFAGFCFTSSEDVPKAIDKILSDEDQEKRKKQKRRKAAAQREAAADEQLNEAAAEADADEVED